MTAQHPQKQAFRLRGVVFLQFCSITKKYAKIQKNKPRNNTKSFQIGARGLPKAMPKTSIKIDTNKIHTNPILEPICSKTRSPNGGHPRSKIKPFWTFLARLLPETSGRPLDPQDHEKMSNKYIFPGAFVICFALRAAYFFLCCS